MTKINDVLIENDKVYAPFLLAASFNGLINYLGSNNENGVLYLRFSPKDDAETLIQQFRTKTEPAIRARDLFDAIDTFWKEVSRAKYARNEEMNYGKS